jgi:hypothetical protein
MVRIYGLAPESATLAPGEYQEYFREIRKTIRTRRDIMAAAIERMQLQAAHAIKNSFIPLRALIGSKLGLEQCMGKRGPLVGKVEDAGDSKEWLSFKDSLGARYGDLRAPILKAVSADLFGTDRVFPEIRQAIQVAPTVLALSETMIDRIKAVYENKKPRRAPTLFSVILRAFALGSLMQYADMVGTDSFEGWDAGGNRVLRPKLRWNGRHEYAIMLAEIHWLLAPRTLVREDKQIEETILWARRFDEECSGEIPGFATQPIARPVALTLAFEEIFYDALKYMQIPETGPVVHLRSECDGAGVWTFCVGNQTRGDSLAAAKAVDRATTGGIPCANLLLRQYPGFVKIEPRCPSRDMIELTFTLDLGEADRV